MRGETGLPYSEMRGSEGSRSECREPDIAISSARKAGSSSESDSLRKVHIRVIYGAKSVSVAMIEVASPPRRY